MELSETEQRLYGELFDRLEDKNAGGKRITGVRASELFLASGLPAETLHRITELCGAKRLGHFGRSQFYIALKLIAAAQAGLPVAIETIGPASGNEIPLPKFSSSAAAAAAAANKAPANAAAVVVPDAAASHYHHHHHAQQSSLDGSAGNNATNFASPTGAQSAAGGGSGAAPASHVSPGAVMTGSTSGVLPPPPNKGHMRSLSNQRMSHLPGESAVATVPVISSQPQLNQPGVNQGLSKCHILLFDLQPIVTITFHSVELLGFRVGAPAPFSPGKPPMSPSAVGPARSTALPPVPSPNAVTGPVSQLCGVTQLTFDFIISCFQK